MRSIHVTLLSLAVLLAAACGGEGVMDPTSTRSASIVNGSVHNGHPAVGMLTSFQGDLVCTASLVAPRWVLTAAHCIRSATGLKEGASFQLEDGTKVAAKRLVPHPDYTVKLEDSTDSAGTPIKALVASRTDIGLVELERAITTVTPMLISDSTPVVGTPLTLVGYGVTSYGATDEGTKHLATNRIAALADSNKPVGPDTYSLDRIGGGVGTTCLGDSGGPSITKSDMERIAGVVSSTLGDCEVASHTRVDLYANWLRTTTNNAVSVNPPAKPDPQPAPTDTTPPQVQLVSPAPNGQVPSQTTVMANAQDNEGVTLVMLTVDGQNQGQLTAPPYSFNVILTPGTHTIEVTAQDAAGNKGQATTTVTVANNTVSTPNAVANYSGGTITSAQGCQLGHGSGSAMSGLVVLLLLTLRRRFHWGS